MRVLFDLTVQLYEILLRVDRRVAVMRHMDSVCDLLYHIKYQFTGNSVKQNAERVVRQQIDAGDGSCPSVNNLNQYLNPIKSQTP